MSHPTPMHSRSWIILILMIIGCEVAGGIGALFTAPAIPTWYATLVKPELNPPSWVFGPVWMMLFALMGIALFLVWRSSARRGQGFAYAAFGVQMVLNVLWSVLFFGWHDPFLAFIDIVALWIAIVATIIACGRVSRTAAWLLMPYILWVSFAGYLNFSLWQVNASAPAVASAVSADPRDATYTIDAVPVALQQGVSEVPAAPGSATKITTRYFGNDATGDMNGDGIPDTGFILTQDPGGSGTFFYVAVALKTVGGYQGTNALLLGDRIAPQASSIKDGVLTINYAERKPNEPMTARPSVGVSRHFVVKDGMLVEVGKAK